MKINVIVKVATNLKKKKKKLFLIIIKKIDQPGFLFKYEGKLCLVFLGKVYVSFIFYIPFLYVSIKQNIQCQNKIIKIKQIFAQRD